MHTLQTKRIRWTTESKFLLRFYRNVFAKRMIFSGEVLFLAWGIRVCYNVRHAESLYNEARLISVAIYNIAAVNIAMVAFQ